MALVRLAYQDVSVARRAARDLRMMGHDAISVTRRVYEPSDVRCEYPITTGEVWADVRGIVDIGAMVPMRYALTCDYMYDLDSAPWRVMEKLAQSQIAILNWQHVPEVLQHEYAQHGRWYWQHVPEVLQHEYAQHGRWYWHRRTLQTQNYVHVVVERSESFDMSGSVTIMHKRIRVY